MERHPPQVQVVGAPESDIESRARTSGACPQSIAIVVTSTADAGKLGDCLEALECCRDPSVEVVVARAGDADEFREVVRRFPTATYVVASADTSTDDLRRIGLLQSSRNIVAFVDDHMRERVAWTAMLCRGWPAWVEKGGRLSVGAGDESQPSARPVLSVVMPVHNGGQTLGAALDAVMRTDLPRERWELVVVDDASEDDTALLAAAHADRLIQLPGRKHGPGYARNRGFEVTLGDCVAFIDADVMVRPDTLRRAAALLTGDPPVDAAFGTYDAHPSATGFVSQYRNLLLHYHQRRQAGESFTFKSACGVIRSSVFDASGGYDEWYFARHQLEDLELGRRLASRGYRIVLDPHLHATHLKRWTLRGMIVSEIVDHAVPWMRLVNRLLAPTREAARSLRATKRWNIALTWLALALALLGMYERSVRPLLGSVACVALVVINNRAQLAYFRQERGLPFAVATIPVDILYYVVCGLGVGTGWFAKEMLGDPRPGPAAEAFSEMAVKRWPPVPVKRAVNPNETTGSATEHDGG